MSGVTVPAFAPLGVDRLVRRNRKQPRPKHAAGLEVVALRIHQQERGLKHVFRQFDAAEIAVQVAEKRLLIAVNERFIGVDVAVHAEPLKQLFVGQILVGLNWVLGGSDCRSHDSSPQPADRPPMSMDEVAAPRLIGECASGVPNPDNPGSRDNPAGFANCTAGRAGPSPPPPPQNATRFAKSGTRPPANLAMSMWKS